MELQLHLQLGAHFVLFQQQKNGPESVGFNPVYPH